MTHSAENPIKVLVTGMGGGGLGEQIVKALRLADTPYHIVGADVSRYSAGLPLVDTPYLLPLADDPGYMDALLWICQKENIKVLFPSSEPELKVVSRNRQAITDAGIFLPINPQEVLDLSLDKNRTFQCLEALGFAILPYMQFSSIDEVLTFEHFPAVLKPATSGGGSAHVYLVQTKADLVACATQILQSVKHCLIQAYVGTPEDEYTAGVLLDMEGNYINAIALRRHIMSALSSRIKAPNLTQNKALGPTLAISSGFSQGEIGTFPDVTDYCKRIALAIGAHSAVNVQCRIDSSGQIYVFEINPRFSGTTSLRAMVGYNEPDVLIRKHLLGETILPNFPYRSGTILRRLQESLVDNDKTVTDACLAAG